MNTPINVCQKYIVVFIIFGAFLERTSISAFFIDLANCVAGSSCGGPAKVAVISSALCGMVSGSSVGNTVTTGSVTIPMMIKTGYKPDFAGAVEAAASTGGQIMPPIMGAAAFLMAEYTGVPYSRIAVLAILPAILYFAGIYIAVHLEAKKLGLKGLDKEILPKFSYLIRKIYLLAPLVVLVVLVSNGTRTMQSSAAIAILVTIVVGLFNSDNRINVSKIIDALEAGGKGTITVASACTARLASYRSGLHHFYRSCIPAPACHCIRIRRCHDRSTASDHALLYRSWYGRSDHRNLLHHGGNLCPDPHEPGNRR